jgi:hypothetical protein
VLISAQDFRGKTTAASRAYDIFLRPRLPQGCLSRLPRPKSSLVLNLSRPPSQERLPAHMHVREPHLELSVPPPQRPPLSRPSTAQDKLRQDHQPPSGEELSPPSKPASLHHPQQQHPAASPPNPRSAQQPQPVSTTTTQTRKTTLFPNPNPPDQPLSQAPLLPSPPASPPPWIPLSNCRNCTAKSLP